MIESFHKLLYLFNYRERWQIFGLFCLILIGAGFEVLGIGLVFPFMSFMSNPKTVNQHRLLKWLYEFFGSPDPKLFLTWIGIGFIIVFLVKNIYLASLAYLQFKFVFDKQVVLSKKLYKIYLDSPYTFHLQRNTAELLRNLTEEINRFIMSLTQLLSLLTEVVIITCIGLLLVFVESLSTLVVIGFLVIAILLFYRIFRKKLSRLGRTGQYHKKREIQQINQGLGGIKEAKVLQREDFFVNNYALECSSMAKTRQFLQILNQMPRLYIETIAVSTLMLIVVILLLQNRNISTIVPTLSLFSAAAFRLIPSMNRAIVAMNRLRFNIHSVNIIHHDFSELQKFSKLAEQYRENSEGNNTIQTLREKIELRSIFYRYNGSREDALRQVSLKIICKQSVGLVGSSGSGKTTIVDVILGLLPPTQGQVLVDGIDIQDNLSNWQKQIGYIPQSIYLCDDTLRRNIAFGTYDTEIREEQIWMAVKSAQLEELVASLPDGLDTMIGEHGIRLSGGQRQRVGIARALYHNPEVLVMDEATAALDNQTEAEVMKAVENLSGKKTLIIIAHRLSTVKSCDSLYFMQKGRVVDWGTYNELLNRNSDFQKMTLAEERT